jgi:hypothetical protein
VQQVNFKKMNAKWVKFSEYKIIEKNNVRYLFPDEYSRMMIYNPLDMIEELVADVLNAGKEIDENPNDSKLAEKLCREFVTKYGLLGWFTFLPLDLDFENKIYLGKRGGFFGKKVMPKEDFIDYFYAKEKRINHPISFTIGREKVFDFVFNKEYGEPIRWLSAFLVDIYLRAYCHINKNNEDLTPDEKVILKYTAEYFHNNGISFTLDGTEVIWETDSLITTIEMLYVLSVAEEIAPIKVCKHCDKIYLHENYRSEFCSPRCRNQFNVYKSRNQTKTE